MKIFSYTLEPKHQKISIFLTILFFLAWKFTSLTFRFGDSNAYFYMADQFSKGILPYRDYFLADPPVMIMFLGSLKLFIGKNIILLQAVPFLLEVASAGLLYLILKKEKNPLAFLAPLFYLFSFSVLATSDFLTGVQLVNLFSLSAFYFYQKTRLKTSGFFWGLAILTKLYALFLLLGFLFFLLSQKKFRAIFSLCLGAVFAALLFLFPFLILAPQETFDYLILHHFNRPGGGNRSAVFFFFFQKEWLLLLLAIAGLVHSKKWSLGLPLATFFVFLLFFQDLYYTYFAALLPFSILLAIIFLASIFESPRFSKFFSALVFLYLLFLLLGTGSYQENHLPFGQFSNAQEIANYLSTQEKRPLYGSHEVAPLIALLSRNNLLENYIDTNPQTFGSGANNKEGISQQVLEKNAYLIARIARRPEYGPGDIGTEGYFSENLFRTNCHELKTFPSPSKEWDNLIIIYVCS